MKYLISKYNLPDHWYPSDLKQRAKIDEYLNWHGTGLRVGCAWYLFNKVHYSYHSMVHVFLSLVVHWTENVWNRTKC